MVSGLLVVVLGARPSAEALAPVGVPEARVGTSYAFDGVLCLGSQVASSTVAGYDVEQSDGGVTALVRPPEGPITLGFPVDAAAGSSVEGFRVPAGDQDCSLRLLVTPQRTGRVVSGAVRVRLRYGPLGLLRRTVEVRPEVSLDVTGTGPDPRSAARR